MTENWGRCSIVLGFIISSKECSDSKEYEAGFHFFYILLKQEDSKDSFENSKCGFSH
jgi:hypothetical protein